jgi:hypothetical protein
VPRSLRDLVAQADVLADRFEHYDPQPGDSETVSPVTAVRLAAVRRAVAERDLAEAIRTAREGRVSWRAIGRAAGTSGEAARQRYTTAH